MRGGGTSVAFEEQCEGGLKLEAEALEAGLNSPESTHRRRVSKNS